MSHLAPVRKIPHPGWACCDPEQDLQGWLDHERARIAIQRRWARVLHTRGRRLDRLSLTALLAGDAARAERLSAASRAAHGRANARGQDALVRAGHADRVEEAHAFRLESRRVETVAPTGGAE